MTGEARSSIVTMVRVRLVSFGLVLGVTFLLIVSLALDTAIQAAGMWLFGDSPFVIIGDIAQLAAGLLILTIAFGALLKFLPDAPVQWRDALVGGVVAALLFSAGKKLFALYLTHVGTASAFGAAESLAVLLMWLYFSAAVLLLGAEFSAARARLHDPRSTWGMQNNGRLPPGSRAKIGSLLAASTRSAAPLQAAASALHGFDGGTEHARQRPRRCAAQRLDTARDRRAGTACAGTGATGTQEGVGNGTRAGAVAQDQTGRNDGDASRKASDANALVRRHPWRAVLVAASAGMAVALLQRRGHGNDRAQHTDTMRS